MENEKEFEEWKQRQKNRQVPRYLYDKAGNQYEVILERHRDGFNLITYRLNYED